MAVSQADNATPPTAPDYATEMQADRERRIYAAACLDDEPVDEQTAGFVRWIAGWDQHTVEGLVALLNAAEDKRNRDNIEDERWRISRLQQLEAALTAIRGVVEEGDTLAVCRVHGLACDAHQGGDR